MVRSYEEILAENKNILNTSLINPNADLPKERFDVAKKKAIREYIDKKILEGYVQNPDGSLSKTDVRKSKSADGSVVKKTYTTTTLRIDNDTGVVTAEVTKVVKKKRRKNTSSSTSQNNSVSNNTSQTSSSTSQNNSVSNNIPQRDDTVVFDRYGQGYSVAPELQESFLKEVNQSSATNSQQQTDVVFDKYGRGYSVLPEVQESFLKTDEVKVQPTFYMPRTINEGETSVIHTPIQVNIPPPEVKKTAGVMRAVRFGEFDLPHPQPYPSDIIEANIIGSLKDSNMHPYAVSVTTGVVAGFGSVIRTGNNLFLASNFNPDELSRAETRSKIVEGVKTVLKNPVSSLFAPVEAVVEDPLYEAPKLAVELFALEGASRITKGGISTVSKINKFDKVDVIESAYPFLSERGQIQVFLNKAEIDPIRSGTPEFTPVFQLTTDIGSFNKNQKYFSNPEIDVPQERIFNLAGLEVIPPKNPKGVLPLVEKEITPFESNPLTINTRGGAPEQVKASSSVLSHQAPNPSGKYGDGTRWFLYKDPTLRMLSDPAMGYKKFIDFDNYDEILFIDNSIQTTLFPVEKPKVINKGSGFPLKLGSESPRISDSIKSDSIKPGLVVEQQESVFEVFGTTTKTTTGSEKKLVVNSDYKYNPESKSYEPIVNSDYKYNPESKSYDLYVENVQLNTDIKGKVTPTIFWSQGLGSLQGSVSLVPTTIQKTNLNTDYVLKQKDKLELEYESEINTDSVFKQKDKPEYIQIQDNEVQVDPMQEKKTNTKLKIDFTLKQTQTQIQKQTQIEKLKFDITPKQLEKTTTYPGYELKIEPPLPKFKPSLNNKKQVKSGFGRFSVFVKKQGKFVKIGSGYSDLATAFNRGKQEIKSTASASFKVVSDDNIIQKFDLTGYKSLRPSKIDPRIVVQKRSLRISSPGEKRDIQQKGVFIRRIRNKLKSTKKKGLFK